MGKKVLGATKEMLLQELERRVGDKVLEPSNAALLKKLICNADNDDEALSIAALGTTYKKTGFHFDKRLEQPTNDIRYLKKNNQLSFQTEERGLTHKLIIGDNYEALQNLQVEYRGQVDVIYIDPPYGKDSIGEFAQTNYENAITRDNLLSMLYPRLMLAKQLMADDGVIFCSIDDKNQAYVKCLFDEVFGEKNSSGVLLWQKKDKPSFLSTNFGTRFEYILCYVKNCNNSYPFSLDTTTIGKKFPINNAGNSLSILKFRPQSVIFNLPDGIIKKQDMSEGNIITELLDDCVIKDGQNLNEFRLKGEFRYNQNKLNKIMDDNDIIYIAKLPFRPNHVKKGGEIKKMENILSKKFMYGCDTNEDGSTQLNSIIENSGFDNPKPKGLIHLLLKATTYCKTNALVLDFFAGSGTTGHAVLALNEADKGSRRFILCQSNEVTETTPNGIAYDVTSKRLKRIMTGECYDGKKDFKWVESNLPYGDNLDVYEIGRVFHAETTEGKTPFDVIDETLYGREKFKTLREKVEWVCSNFENCQKCVQNDDEWESDKRVRDDATRS